MTIPNNVLQGQFKEAGINSLRFSINTTLGIAGIFDVASYYGLKKLDKDSYLGVYVAYRYYKELLKKIDKMSINQINFKFSK